MLTEYLDAAMRHARFEVLIDDGSCYGEIPECQGVYAKAPTLQACQRELLNVLEDWLLFRVYRHLGVPRIDGIGLSIKNDMDREHTPTPPVLYKYYAFNKYTQDIFERNEVFFQSPDGFNDPSDSRIPTTYEGTEKQRLDRVIQAWHEGPAKGKDEKDLRPQARGFVKDCRDVTLMRTAGKQAAEKIRKGLGVFCMTSKRDNILMWSHYAAAHAGFCLGFQTETEFFGQAHPVVYRSDRACLNVIERPSNDDVFCALVAKARDWEYEDEWRVIINEGPGARQFPSEMLSEVILGCRTSPEDGRRVIRWCRARNPQPTVYWSEEKDRDFGLDIKRVS